MPSYFRLAADRYKLVIAAVGLMALAAGAFVLVAEGDVFGGGGQSLLLNASVTATTSPKPSTIAPITAPKAATPTPSPKRTVAPTPIPSPISGTPSADFQSFREFASQIDKAIQDKDVNFFLSRVSYSTATCPTDLADCTGVPDGSTVEGLVFGKWQGDGYLLAKDKVSNELASDMASGTQLESLANDPFQAGSYWAITELTPTENAGTFALGFKKQDGQWRLTELVGGVPLTACGGIGLCYGYWEPWAGRTPRPTLKPTPSPTPAVGQGLLGG
jgi:hypothetical protein